MKRSIILLFICFLFSNLNSQAKFKEGYYLNNSFDTIKVLVKDEDWLNSPKTIIIKETAVGVEKELPLNELQEIAITNTLKYVKRTVEIDRSSEDLEKLSVLRNPEFQKRRIVVESIGKRGSNFIFLYPK